MVFILGAGNDQSTNEVIEWLIRFRKQYLRINTDDQIFIRKIEIDNENDWDVHFSINSDPKIYAISSITAFWYRKGFLQIYSCYPEITFGKDLYEKVDEFIAAECNAISDLFIFLLQKKRCLGNFQMRIPNKLVVLTAAKNVGLDIPSTLITSEKKELIEFKKRHEQIICKSIQDIFTASNESHRFYSRTALLDNGTLEEMGEQFSPSLIQEKLEKQFDIRIYYMKGQFYSIALFSQTREETRIDFRHYDHAMPSKIAPYKLPDFIEIKLSLLLDELSIDTASVDMVLTVDQRHVFLEVNPNGQFAMISKNCNHDIERQIALFLIA